MKVNRVMDCWEVIVLIGGTAGPVNTIVRVHVYLDLKKKHSMDRGGHCYNINAKGSRSEEIFSEL